MEGTHLSPAMVWAIAGVILIVIELASFTFVLAFLGVGALVTALVTWLGMTPETNTQLAAFSISSLLLLILFRKTARRMFAGQGAVMSDDIGQRVTVIKEIPAGGEGDVLYRGSVWNAVSDSSEAIPEDAMVEITATEGIRLRVKRVS
ncbi:MAG: NfeD family protein [Deltaproteobacteria bacterium]|nr:NfeD family protein [Deltaproteobacteria bacterium]